MESQGDRAWSTFADCQTYAAARKVGSAPSSDELRNHRGADRSSVFLHDIFDQKIGARSDSKIRINVLMHTRGADDIRPSLTCQAYKLELTLQ